MKSYRKKSRGESEERAASSAAVSRQHAVPSSKFVDNRSSTIAQRQLVDAISSESACSIQLQSEDEELQMKVAAGVVQREGLDEDELMQGKFDSAQRAGIEDEALLQGKFEAVQCVEEEDELLQGKFSLAQRVEDDELLQGKFNSDLVQQKPATNNTGLPDNLKAGIETLSGYAMDDVKVHYNSSKPSQLNAHAYAQGTDIHVASGQEQHLPHEAWHVAQQKQGRVKPTMQMKGGVKVNDDASLEKEADVMGAKASQYDSQLPA